MATENENVKQEGEENAGEQKHSTWKDIIHEESQKINSEFPLSGGETEEDFSGHKSESTENEPHEHHSLLDNIASKIHKLDTEFPLSGGETEEDFEGVDDKEEGEE